MSLESKSIQSSDKLTIVDVGLPSELFERVVLGKTENNKAGFACFPSDEELLDLVEAFFDSAIKGNEEVRSGFINLVSTKNLDNVYLLNYYLRLLDLNEDSIDDVKAGFQGILGENQGVLPEQIDLAVKFAGTLL